MSCSDYISPSKSLLLDDITADSSFLLKNGPSPVTMTTNSGDRHDPPCELDAPLTTTVPTVLITSVKYDYDPSALLAESESLIGPDYDPSLYDVDVNEIAKKEAEER